MNIKTVNISSPKLKLPDNYHTFLKVSELREQGYTLQQVVEYAAHEALKKEEDGLGMVFLLFDKYEDVLVLPSYETMLYLRGQLIPEEQYDSLPTDAQLEAELTKVTTHNVDWTEDLELDKRYRLYFMYLEDDIGADEFIDHMDNNWTPRHPSMVWSYLSCK